RRLAQKNLDVRSAACVPPRARHTRGRHHHHRMELVPVAAHDRGGAAAAGTGRDRLASDAIRRSLDGGDGRQCSRIAADDRSGLRDSQTHRPRTGPGQTRRFTMKRRASITAVLTAALALSCVACAPPESSTTLSFRLWDPNVAAAYRTSFDAFEAKTGHRVDIVVIPWEDYWSQLRTDIASGTIDDVFWTNATNLAEYARAGTLSAVSPAQIADQSRDWAPSVVSQFTLDGELWGVPQLT